MINKYRGIFQLDAHLFSICFDSILHPIIGLILRYYSLGNFSGVLPFSKKCKHKGPPERKPERHSIVTIFSAKFQEPINTVL